MVPVPRHPPKAPWWRRSRRAALVAILVLGALLRFGWLAVGSDTVQFAGLAAENGNVAHNIVTNGRWFVLNDATSARRVGTRVSGSLTPPISTTEPPIVIHDTGNRFWNRPDPPFCCAGIWSITGNQRFIYLQALQLLIDSVMVLLVYWLSLKLFDRTSAALLTSGLYAIYLPSRRLESCQWSLGRGRGRVVEAPARGARYNRGDKGSTSDGATNRAPTGNLPVERATPLRERTVAVLAAKE